ncbi:MAG TPA: SPOR domain-containing protein [Methylomirabilota bacterium]|nr:SPOR domain-containing protein [Methylomirabilota bacterium]
MSPDPDDYLEDDEEQQEYAPRSIFSAGWFRAVLFLLVLAIVVIVSVPYLRDWIEPTPPSPPKLTSRPSPGEPQGTLIPAPPAGTASKPESAPSATPTPPPSASAPSAAAPAPTAPVKPGEPATTPATKPPAASQTQPAPSKPLLQPPSQKAASRPERPPQTAKATEPSRAASAGSYFVQVGLFKEPRNAEGLAKTLRDQGLSVEVARVTRGGEAPSGPRQHELFVTGASVDAVNAALKGRGVAQPAPGGVSVRPAYTLKDATALSKQLTTEGLQVVIRRAGSSTGAGVFHVVRVGGFADRGAAISARDDLAGKGHPGFLTQGPAK